MVTETDAIMAGFRCDDHTMKFRVKADMNDEFWAAIEYLKRWIPRSERTWDEDNKQWVIVRTPNNENVLKAVFANGEACIRYADAQLKLF